MPARWRGCKRLGNRRGRTAKSGVRSIFRLVCLAMPQRLARKHGPDPFAMRTLQFSWKSATKNGRNSEGSICNYRFETFLGPNKKTKRRLKGSGVLNWRGWLYDGGFEGRPRARSVDCKPNCLAVRPCHDSPPNGAPRTTDRRNAANSASLSTDCTCRRQSRGKGTGPSSRRVVATPWTRCQRLDQRHSSARSTRFARSAFRSTYRSTAHK